MRDGQTCSGNGGCWSGGGEAAWAATSQASATDSPPKWAKFSWGWQEKSEGKARPHQGLGSISPEWNLDHHQQTLVKRSHSTAPDTLEPSSGRRGNLVYSNTSQLCKGMVILSLPTFGRCLNLGMCCWDVPISQIQVLCHDSGRKQNELEKPHIMI